MEFHNGRIISGPGAHVWFAVLVLLHAFSIFLFSLSLLALLLSVSVSIILSSVLVVYSMGRIFCNPWALSHALLLLLLTLQLYSQTELYSEIATKNHAVSPVYTYMQPMTHYDNKLAVSPTTYVQD